MNNHPQIAALAPVKQTVEPGIYAYCTCGYSSNQPFCDWSCQGTDFEPIKVRIEQRQRISWCACKHTGKAPFCDGTHKQLRAQMEGNAGHQLP